MAVSIDDTINQRSHGVLGWLFGRQTFWVFAAAIAACLARVTPHIGAVPATEHCDLAWKNGFLETTR